MPTRSQTNSLPKKRAASGSTEAETSTSVPKQKLKHRRVGTTSAASSRLSNKKSSFTAKKTSKMAASTTSGDANSQGIIYFWREFEEPYGFLSQWYDDPFEVDGVTYQSAEMWMMIQKARLFGDEVSSLLATSLLQRCFDKG